jgi:hypothetical protein
MSLPFLKKRRSPRIASEPQDSKLINGSPEDHIDDHMVGELMEAAKDKNIGKFRSALEALVLNCFETEDTDG